MLCCDAVIVLLPLLFGFLAVSLLSLASWSSTVCSRVHVFYFRIPGTKYCRSLRQGYEQSKKKEEECCSSANSEIKKDKDISTKDILVQRTISLEAVTIILLRHFPIANRNKTFSFMYQHNFGGESV
jgi:hypothetical protein